MGSQPLDDADLLRSRRRSTRSSSDSIDMRHARRSTRSSSDSIDTRHARFGVDEEVEMLSDPDDASDKPAEVPALMRRRTTRRWSDGGAGSHAMCRVGSLFPERDNPAGTDDVAGLIMRRLDSTRRPSRLVFKCKSEGQVRPSMTSLADLNEEEDDDAAPNSREESPKDDDCDVERKQIWSVRSIQLLASWTIFVVAAVGLAVDLYREGLGVKNLIVPSVADSLSSCASFRNYRPSRQYSERRVRHKGRKGSLYSVTSPRNSWLQSLAIVVLNLCSKFGSATVGSLLLGETPVILQGPRHMISWCVVFALIQVCPADLVFNMLHENSALRFILRVACAVYKLRKFNFVVNPSCWKSFSALYVLLVQAVVIDGNSIAQRTCTSLMTFRLGFELSSRELRRSSSTGGWLFVSELWPEIQAVLRHAAPLTALTVAGRCALPYGSVTFLVRILVLAFFLHRCDAHGAALQCWRERPWDGLSSTMRSAIATLCRASKRMCWL